MQTIVFLIYHGMGHFNACFRMAKMLGKDHNVIFAGVEFFKDYVEGQGIMYYPLKTLPFGMGFEGWANQQRKNKHLYTSTLKDKWNDTLYNAREAELHQLLHDLSPDYILIDSYQSTDFIVLYPFIKGEPVKLGFVQTMLPTVIHEGYPPINSLVFPSDKKGITKAVRKFRRIQRYKKLKQKINYLGMSDQAIINRRIKKNEIPEQYLSSEMILRGVPFSNIPEFILTPKEFDFEQSALPDYRRYIGFLVDPARIEIADREYFKIDSILLKKLRDTQSSLIYCSFGTVKVPDSFAINSFLQKLLNTVRDTDSIVIISINAVPGMQKFEDIPENVYFLKAVPQLEVLKRADVFITHGGLNSIKESIHAGVPMLVYPLPSHSDTIGNSTRIVFHNLGLRGDLLKDTEDDIGTKIEALIQDSRFRENIAKLQQIDELYAEKIEEHFNLLRYIV